MLSFVAIEEVNAITLGTHDMARAVAFYTAMGFEPTPGGRDPSFVVLRAGRSFLNVVLAAPETRWSWWGRVIFHVDDVDATHARALSAGYEPEFAPKDAPWGERYFHIIDPDGHELSFAKRL